MDEIDPKLFSVFLFHFAGILLLGEEYLFTVIEKSHFVWAVPDTDKHVYFVFQVRDKHIYSIIPSHDEHIYSIFLDREL